MTKPPRPMIWPIIEIAPAAFAVTSKPPLSTVPAKVNWAPELLKMVCAWSSVTALEIVTAPNELLALTPLFNLMELPEML